VDFARASGIGAAWDCQAKTIAPASVSREVGNTLPNARRQNARKRPTNDTDRWPAQWDGTVTDTAHALMLPARLRPIQSEAHGRSMPGGVWFAVRRPSAFPKPSPPHGKRSHCNTHAIFLGLAIVLPPTRRTYSCARHPNCSTFDNAPIAQRERGE
jgi:hypothetical protein